MKTTRGIILSSVMLGIAATSAAGQRDAPVARGAWVDQVYAQSPADNPLKGLLPFAGEYPSFPHSMEWAYIPWNTLQQDEQTVTWAPLDAVLAEIASRGHQAAFRIYTDYPNRPSALPAFLSGVRQHAYDDHDNRRDATSYAPDYDDPRLVRAMLALIRALGARYDGDPRIGFITVGFLGFWGEWHTHRPSCDCDEWMASQETQRAVLGAFDKAFSRTKLLVRYADVGWDDHDMGFHDDAFAHQTVEPPDWVFMGKVRRAGATRQWRREPIGGELMPPLQPCAFSVPSCIPAGQEFDRSVQSTHASWLVDHYAFQSGHTEEDRKRAVAAARSLGYELFVSAVKLRDVGRRDRIRVEVRMRNRGVAPFYYDWPLSLAIAGPDGVVLRMFRTGWKLTRVVDDARDVGFRSKLPRIDLAPGTYTVLLRAENPLPHGRPLVFANDGWERTAEGWLSLGRLRVRGDD